MDSMKKNLLALAVAGALAPAAAMAQSSVEIYGRLNLAFDQWKASGATAGAAASFDSRFRVVDGSSRVGFRINENLGGGMRVFGVIETGVNVDNGSTTGQGGQANSSSGVWASRDSYLGLGGGWGDIRLGRQSIWWSNGVIAQTGANYLYTAADSLITGHMLAAPVTRQSNVISYNSPTMGGFNVSLSYSPHDQEPSSFTGAGAQEKGSIMGFTARYTSGALRAQFDWATRQNVANVEDRNIDGIKLGVGWAYAPGSQISGILGQIKHENFGVAAAEVLPLLLLGGQLGPADPKVRFWLLNWEHMIGQWQVLAQLYKSDEIKGVVDPSGTEVTAYTLGAKYFLSKRTGIYAAFHKIKNDDFAWADHTGGAITSGPLGPLNAGADPQIIGVGVMHNF